MRISDWSSDVCSSDLEQVGVAGLETQLAEVELLVERHVVRSVIRAELRRQRIGVEHIRPRHVARHDEIRSEEHTSELQSLMRISYAVFCLKKKTNLTISLITLSTLM